MVLHPGLVNDFDFPAKLLVLLLYESGVLRIRHVFVGVTHDMQQRDARLGERLQVVDRTLQAGARLGIGEAIDLQQARPVFRAVPLIPLTERPTADVAHRCIVVDAGDFSGIPRRPVQREQSAAAESLQHHLTRQPAARGHAAAESIHRIKRRLSAVEILHIQISDVPASGQQRRVRLRLVIEELHAPDPRTPRRRLHRAHEKRRPSPTGEIMTFATAPFADAFG